MRFLRLRSFLGGARWPKSYLADSKMQFDEARLWQLLRFFYLALLVIECWIFTRHLNLQEFSGALWLWPAQWLGWLDPAVGLRLIFGSAIFCHSVCALCPEARWVKGLGALLFFELMAINYSFGKIDHDFHGMIYAAFFISFISAGKQKRFRPQIPSWQFLLWGAQFAFVSSYFLAGLWKLRALIGMLVDYRWDEVNMLVLNLAANRIQGAPETMLAQRLSAIPGELARWAWICVILFELSCIVAPFLPRWQKYWGIAIIWFHLSFAVFMNIYFIGSMLLAGILLVCTPYVEMRNSRAPQRA